MMMKTTLIAATVALFASVNALPQDYTEPSPCPDGGVDGTGDYTEPSPSPADYGGDGGVDGTGDYTEPSPSPCDGDDGADGVDGTGDYTEPSPSPCEGEDGADGEDGTYDGESPSPEAGDYGENGSYSVDSSASAVVSTGSIAGAALVAWIMA